MAYLLSGIEVDFFLCPQPTNSSTDKLILLEDIFRSQSKMIVYYH